jgi:hypothetical protein
MADNCQRPGRSAHRHSKHHHHLNPPASQPLATSCDLAKAPTNEDYTAPASRLQFNGTYPSQLEIPEHEETPVCSRKAFLDASIMPTYQGATIAASTPWTTTPDGNFNYSNQPPYAAITRPWEAQLPCQPSTYPTYSDHVQTPLAVWESQSSIKEPFNNIGEVATKPARPQQDKPSDQNSRHGERQTRRGS